MFQFVGQSDMRADWFSIEASVSCQREKRPAKRRGVFTCRVPIRWEISIGLASTFRFLWLGALVFGVCHANGQQYELGGTLDLRTYLGEKIHETFCYRFSMAVDGCNWFVRATVKERTENGVIQSNNFDYVEAGSDGVNVFTVYSMETQAKWQPHMANVAVGSIGNGTMPCDSSAFIKDLWLGMASHCYFASLSNAWLYPLFLDRQSASSVRGPFAVKGYWRILPGEPGLPASVVFTFEFAGKVDSAASVLPDLYKRTNVVMSVLECAKLENWIVPKHFKIWKYSPNGRLTQETEVRVETATRLLSRHSFRPSLPGATYISDFRLCRDSAQVEAVTYVATNWPPLAEVQPVAEVQSRARMEAAGYLAGRSRKPQLVRLALFAVFGFIPVSAFLVLRLRNAKNSKQ